MQSNVKLCVASDYAFVFLLVKIHHNSTLNVKGGDHMKMKALALAILVFCAVFATSAAIEQICSRQAEGSFGLRKAFFVAYASNDTIVTPNGEIDTPGGPT